MRLRLRRRVLLPHPEGPMNAVMSPFGIDRLTSPIAGLPA